MEDENALLHGSRGAILQAQPMATRKYEDLLGDGTWNEVRMAFRRAHDANGWGDGSLVHNAHRRLPKDKRTAVELSDASLVTASK